MTRAKSSSWEESNLAYRCCCSARQQKEDKKGLTKERKVEVRSDVHGGESAGKTTERQYIPGWTLAALRTQKK